jgi:hypothetical protein
MMSCENSPFVAPTDASLSTIAQKQVGPICVPQMSKHLKQNFVVQHSLGSLRTVVGSKRGRSINCGAIQDPIEADVALAMQKEQINLFVPALTVLMRPLSCQIHLLCSVRL